MLLVVYVHVWSYLVCLMSDVSEEFEEEEANYEHGIVEGSYLVYEWPHIQHQFHQVTHTLYAVMSEGWEPW